MTVAHPELALEQAYVERAYGLLDRGLVDAEHNYQAHGATNRATASAMKRALEILRASRGTGQLIFGRIDQQGEPLYIGRRRVYDEHKDLVAISWHAPAAVPYYEATPADPQGLDLKRVFVEEDRRLKRVIDEVVSSSAAAIAAGSSEAPELSDALLQELDRSRDGAMREVVATIQAEQFRIIRADRDCVLVVQGGPGTGKTVVGLHRAAWLAFNDEALRRQGILVVAPTRAFLSYISGVLPSLDATDIYQADLPSLYAGEASVVAADDQETSRVKGSAEMAQVLARALAARIGWPAADLELSLGADRFRVPADEIRTLLDDLKRRDLPHNEARDVLRQSLASLAFRYYTEGQRAIGRPVVTNEATIRRLSAFTNALDRMWPTFTPEELLRSLYSTQAWLTEAAAGVLTADDRARLYRPQQPVISDEPWTLDDLLCLDELAHLLNGDIVRYGHVVVDEAQDLSPMQGRALGRRCPSGSFTILGDLAQATGCWIRDSWEELTVHLSSGPARVETLTVGYRVPAQVLELAARQLPLISPGLTAPKSVRRGMSDPSAIRVKPVQLAESALDLAADLVGQELKTALIVSDRDSDDFVALCAERGLRAGDGQDGDFAHALTVVPASLTKGLEFDAVVLVAPEEIATSSADGRRTLYVAMTRCTQSLHLVHTAALPEGFEALAKPEAPLALPGPRSTPTAEPLQLPYEPELDELIGRLNADDRELVAQLVRRLLAGRHASQEGSFVVG